jgi:nitrate/nitrite-specific signal transduction histidine kinase
MSAYATDLETALRVVVEDYNASSRMKFLLSVETLGQKDMDPVARDEVYWIAYEVIRNAYSHSGACQVHIDLIVDNNLTLHIRDDGRGIPEQTLNIGKPGHFGLKGVRERASHIGAMLTIFSSPRSGTDVNLVVPGGAAVLFFSRPGKLGEMQSRPEGGYCLLLVGANVALSMATVPTALRSIQMRKQGHSCD